MTDIPTLQVIHACHDVLAGKDEPSRVYHWIKHLQEIYHLTKGRGLGCDNDVDVNEKENVDVDVDVDIDVDNDVDVIMIWM